MQIDAIPLSQVHLNPANPRGYINSNTVDALAASMAIEGQKSAIKVTPLGMGHYQVVGGDHRVLAAKKLGWETIQAEVLDIAPDQAFLDAYLDNQGQPMSWFADYRAIETLWNQTDRSKGTQKPIAARLMKSEAVVSKALTLMPLLNAPARESILSLGKNGDEENVTQKAILALTGLATGQPDDQDRVWATLQVLIRHKMAEPQAKALVAWVQAGNDPTGFDPKVAPKAKTAHIQPSQDGSAPSHTTPVSPKPETSSTPTPRSPSAPPQVSTLEKAGWDLLAGLPVATQIRAKIKKGERPSLGESFILVLDLLYRAILWVGKHGLKIGLWFFKETGRLLKESLKTMLKAFGKRVYATAKFVLSIAMFLLVVWLIFDFYTTRLTRTGHLAYSLMFKHRSEAAAVTPVATPLALVPASPTVQAVTNPSYSGTLTGTPAEQPTNGSQLAVSTQAHKPIHEPKSLAAAPTPTAQKTEVVAQAPTSVPTKGPDLLGQAAGNIAKAGAADGVRKLFGL